MFSRSENVALIPLLCGVVHNIKHVLQSRKVQRPETRHLVRSRKSANIAGEERRKTRRTNRIPSPNRRESLSATAWIRTVGDIIYAWEAISV